MHRLLLSLAVLVFAGGLVAGGTGAFFSDTETSTGNVFAAGALDLKVDSTAHYNHMVCVPRVDTAGYNWQPEPGAFPNGVPADHYPQPGTQCEGTWAETDLGPSMKFFNLSDIKPGDEGENTISLHVYDNDAWGRFVISGVTDLDNTCTEPESEVGAEEPECPAPSDTPATTPGELAENIQFYAWVDQGATPGFQNVDGLGELFDDDSEEEGVQLIDPTEGDNVWQCAGLTDPAQYPAQPPVDCNEPLVILPGDVDENPNEDQTLPDETHNIWPALAALYSFEGCTDADGGTDYGLCQGLAADGRMVGSTTYYFGLAWDVPTTVGNEAQTDSLTANLTFEAVQHRNNPTQQF